MGFILHVSSRIHHSIDDLVELEDGTRAAAMHLLVARGGYKNCLVSQNQMGDDNFAFFDDHFSEYVKLLEHQRRNWNSGICNAEQLPFSISNGRGKREREKKLL